MLARQREGIAKAKDKGVFKGRTPTARRKSDIAMQLIADSKKPTDIAKELNIGRSSVYRIIAEQDNLSAAG